MIPEGRQPHLAIEGPALVLRDAYAAASTIRVGDALKVAGEWRVAPTQAADDKAIGLAANSANPNEPVGVVVAGLFPTVVTDPVERGHVLTPAAERGMSRPTNLLPVAALATAHRHAVAVESQLKPGRPAWVHVTG